MEAMEFSREFHKKQLTVDGFNRMLRQSCEFEAVFTVSASGLSNGIVSESGRFATNQGLNDGNGFNSNVGYDGGYDDSYINNKEASALEISTSPFDGVSAYQIKKEMEQRINLLSKAGNGIYHGSMSSTHLHITTPFFTQRIQSTRSAWETDYVTTNLLHDLPLNEIYNNIAHLFVAFMPVLKWFSMTTRYGARSACGNSYCPADGDTAFTWYENNFAFGSDGNASNIPHRSSYLRFIDANQGTLHWENRMMDACASPTVLTAWFVLNRAITMMAFDFAMNGYQFKASRTEVFNSREAMGSHRMGWKHVNRKYIEERWELLKSYLYKYFKKANSLETLDILDKLIEKPVPQWLEENGLTTSYKMTDVEKLFNVRNASRGNEELRNKYMEMIKRFAIPMADSLVQFHKNVAATINIEERQAVSLYQMFKRENVDIEFVGGRLVYMGD